MSSDITESIKAKSPFRRGADDGIIMGLLLVAVFFTGTLSFSYTLASDLTPILMLAGVPLLTYFLLRRSYVRDNGMTLFSSLWMQGIVTFFCGSLILAIVMYVYMRWGNPGFMREMVSRMSEFYDSMPETPQSREVSQIFHTMLDENVFPSAINVAIESIWLGVFSGSLLSMLATLAARARRVIPRSDDNRS
ncbi:MAG: DUF4199 domain-containing protein [Muribaculaceae bacterium]|nr:DUF4199 domain-containing protein [Muribaculaceae bacterium]